MPDSNPLILLSVAGTELPIQTHHARCEVVDSRLPSGRRTLSIRAAGWYPPDLSAVTWTAAVSIGWRDLRAATPSWKTLSVLSSGPQITSDLLAPGCEWSLEGTEAPGGSVAITVGGVAYTGKQSVAPVGGLIQRRTSGAGSILRAWGKRRVRITGESATAPAISPGTVAVSGPVYTGNILCLGLAAEIDSETGLYSWTVEGEEP